MNDIPTIDMHSGHPEPYDTRESTSELETALTGIFFKAAGGISDMARDEVAQVMALLTTHDTLRARELPMGVSAWLEHGEKYGYLKFYDDLRARIHKEIDRRKW